MQCWLQKTSALCGRWRWQLGTGSGEEGLMGVIDCWQINILAAADVQKVSRHSTKTDVWFQGLELEGLKDVEQKLLGTIICT